MIITVEIPKTKVMLRIINKMINFPILFCRNKSQFHETKIQVGGTHIGFEEPDFINSNFLVGSLKILIDFMRIYLMLVNNKFYSNNAVSIWLTGIRFVIYKIQF